MNFKVGQKVSVTEDYAGNDKDRWVNMNLVAIEDGPWPYRCKITLADGTSDIGLFSKKEITLDRMFKLGDKVSAPKYHGAWDNMTITKLVDDGHISYDELWYHATKEDGYEGAFPENELVLIEDKMPAKWAVERALEQIGPTNITYDEVMADPTFYVSIIAFADYIEYHEEEPADPLIEEARQITASIYDEMHRPLTAAGVRDSTNPIEDFIACRVALAALKRGIEIGEAK